VAEQDHSQQAGQAATAARLASCEAALQRVKDLAYRWSLGNATTKAAAAELRDAISGRI